MMRILRFIWSFIRPSKLPRCPRCGKRLGALDDDHWRYCPHREEKPNALTTKTLRESEEGIDLHPYEEKP